MIKNATIYRLASDLSDFAEQTEDALSANTFAPCAPSQEKSTGWIPPRGDEHGPLLEIIGSQWILKLMTEVKVIPGDVIDRKAKERIAHIEATTGRKPGKKETREIKDDIKLELLPTAFTKQATTLVWIDPVAKLLVIDQASQAKVDDVVTMLVKSLDGLAVAMFNTNATPALSMSLWLESQEAPSGFTVDRACELKAQDESKAVVKYANHALDIPEIQQHLAQGMLPTSLAMTWNSRVSFVLTESMALKKIDFLDVTAVISAESADNFDADVAIMTGELSKLIPDLILALDGEVIFTT